MKRIILLAAVAAFVFGTDTFAQQRAGAPEGGLSPQILEKIAQGYAGNPSDKAIKNALAGTSIATLAINSENAAMIDTHFRTGSRQKVSLTRSLPEDAGFSQDSMSSGQR